MFAVFFRFFWAAESAELQGLPPGARPEANPKTLENRVHELQKQVG